MASGGQRDIEIQAHVGRTALSENWYHAKWQESFLASEEYENTSVGDTSTLFVENPAGSGVTAVFSRLIGNPSAKSYVRVYDAFDADPSGGAAVDVENNLLDSSGEGEFDSGSITVQRGVSFTATNTFTSSITGGGVGEGTHSGRASMDPVMLEPGRRMLVEVEKLVSDGADVVIEASWFEIDTVFSEESKPYADGETY